MENETEDEILARALEESIRHYNEVELPRLTQAESKPGNNQNEDEKEEVIAVEDSYNWEEWDEVQLEDVVQIGDAVKNGGELTEAQKLHHNDRNKNKCSSKLMDNYFQREIIPKQSNVSVGEIGNDGADGFDIEAGRRWIYPCNLPVRKYQLDIVHSALFDNTLVSLPTGLGKTFIAAVVMYNFYRWFPMGKIVFLAPTRPLVAQQIHACYSIMGIPQEDTAELTGSKYGIQRAKEWKEKRVFFATPQVFANDLGTGVCPGEMVRCVVVDEAHRAAGNHSICQSFRSLLRLRERYPKCRFRVVALSATPGKNAEAVASVVSTLNISKLELRDELSPDVTPYTHQRNLETVVVPLSPELIETRDKFIAVLNCYISRLTKRNFLRCGQISKLTVFQLLLARETFRKTAPQGMNYSEKGLIEGDFATCITLVYALGLLLTHGERTFMSSLQAVLNGDKGSATVKSRLCNNVALSSLLSHLQGKFGAAMPQPAPDTSVFEGLQVLMTTGAVVAGVRMIVLVRVTRVIVGRGMVDATKGDNNGSSFITSHPKMNHLRDIVVGHFENFQKNLESTRAMIFCQYRDPVVEICNMLMCHWPLIKPMSFVGQASSSGQVEPGVPGPSKVTKGFTQKQQLQVIKRFREGGYNVLVSTCVGEEGLDIGEVDLIVCYDVPHASPLRLVQRMGRTGRKREGRVVTLVTKDVEELKHQQGLRQKSTILKSLLTSKALEASLSRQNARVLPPGTDPSCYMMPMTVSKLEDDIGKKSKKSKVRAEKNTSLEDMLKKGKRKASTKSIGINSDNGFGREMEGGEGCINSIGETSSGNGKCKGRGKTLKNTSKVKPKKGIKEFFNVQKSKVMEAIVLSDGDAGDDDFIGTKDKKMKTPYHEDCDEVVLEEEDVPATLHSPPLTVVNPSSTNKVKCQSVVPNIHQFRTDKEAVFSEAIIFPPNLLVLENSLSMLFENLCCRDFNMDSPFRCSLIMPYFQISHSTYHSPNIFPVLSLDSVTAVALENFDAEKEANKIGTWKQNSFVTPNKSIGQSFISNYGIGAEKHDLFGRNSAVPLWSSSHLMNNESLNNKQLNRTNNTGVNIINDFVHNEVIEILDSDEEQTINAVLQKKKSAASAISTNCNETVEEGLLWNMHGQNEVKAQYVGTSKCISYNSKDEKLEMSDLGSKKTLMLNECSTSNRMPNDVDNIVTMSSHQGNSRKLDNTMMELIPPLCNNNILISPDIMEDGYSSLHERTPEKEAENTVLRSKDQSCDNLNLQKQLILASSTPKLHRKKLFSPQPCLPSPIGHSSKRTVDTVDPLPGDMNFLDNKPLFPHGSRTSPPHLSIHPKKTTTADLENTSDNIELPNFSLGSDYEFSSTFSDESVFEPEINCNKEVDFSSISLRRPPGKGDEHSLTPEDDNLNDKAIIQKHDQGILQLRMEKSGDLFENTLMEEMSRTKVMKSIFPGQHMLGDIYDHSFTVTQAVNMLVSSEIPLIGNEEEKGTEMRQVELKQQQYKKCESVELSCLAKADKLSLSNKGMGEIGKSETCTPVERASGAREKVSGSLVNNGYKVSNSGGKNVNVVKEINFDIGDDILLDLSADLFAEEDAAVEDKKGSEIGAMESQQFPSYRTPQMKVMLNDEINSPEKLVDHGAHEEVGKSTDNGVHEKSQEMIKEGNEDFFHQPRGKFQEVLGNKSEHFVLKSVNKFQQDASCISGWNTDGWLSKGGHFSKKKLSLGLKGNKRECESEMPPGAKIHPNKGKDSRVEICKVDDEIILKPPSFTKSKQGHDWIDEISTERTVLEVIDDAERKQEELLHLPEAAISKKDVSLANDGCISSLEFEDPDFVFQPKSHAYEEHDNFNKEVESTGIRHNTNRILVKNSSQNHLQSSSHEPKVEGIKGDVLQCHRISLGNNKPNILKKEDILDCKRKELSKEVSCQLDDDLHDCLLVDQFENNYESELGESSDEFEGQKISKVKRKQKGINSKDISSSSEEKSIRVKRVHRKRSHQFLDTQAEESFVEIKGVRRLSSDEDDDDGRGQSQYYDPSFINDEGHNSQETEVDIHAKYLQSVRSPRNAKFKIPNFPLLEAGNDDFAGGQEYHPGESDSSYMNDSFCVDAGSNSDGKEESVDELEVLEAILADSSKNKKRRQAKGESSPDELVEAIEVKHDKKKEKRITGHRKKQKRKRIIMHDSSEDEQDYDQISPKKRSLRSEAEISIIDDNLFEALSQNFEEPPELLQPPQVGAKCFLPVHKVDGNVFCDNMQAIEQDSKSGCDSKLFSEKTSLATEEKIVRNETAVRKKSAEYIPHDSVVVSYERNKDNESGENSNLKTEMEKKSLSANERISVNWSSDLFNFSDDDDELFSVIKSPPDIPKSLSTDKVIPASNFPMVPKFCVEKNQLSECEISSVCGMNSKKIECNNSPSDSGTQVKVLNRNAVHEDPTTSLIKSNCSVDSPFFNDVKPNHSSLQNFNGHLKRCGSINRKSLGAGKEIPPPRPSLNSCDGPLVSGDGKNNKNVGVKEVLIIVSPVEACRASEVMSALRAIKGVRLVVYAASGSPSIPYSLGRNLCLLRVSAAGLGRNSKASDAMQTASGLFQKIAVIVEWEKECDGGQNNWSKKKSNYFRSDVSVPASFSTSVYIALMNLRHANVDVLFSSGQVETAHLIAEVARHQQELELQLNMPSVSLPESLDLSDPVLKFYSSLPGLNTFQAFSLLQQFPKMSDFLKRCISARSIQSAAGLDLNKALHLHKILANVHVSET
ncbi:uncharacterized protein Fancm [Hetaerina americana]|uniref:uncharacterized protein Fancm n=1 Tax=Hetaerina americana TaxID=62018 RepID=UPI003A7F3B4D